MNYGRVSMRAGWMDHTITVAMAVVMLLLSGCAATSDSTGANSETAQAATIDEQAKRECLRKMRRTGSRIPRDACDGQSGIFGSGYHLKNDSPDTGEAAIP